jgi:alpha-galactosidase
LLEKAASAGLERFVMDDGWDGQREGCPSPKFHPTQDM